MIRILLAEKRPHTRFGFRKLLGAQPDLEVVAEAGDAREVLGALDGFRPDVLLLDLELFEPRNKTLRQALSRLTLNIKVIGLSASGDNNAVVQAMKLGCCGLLLKGTAIHRIVKSVIRVYHGDVQLGPRIVTPKPLSKIVPALRTCGPPTRTGLRASLSLRELEVVQLIKQGLTNKQVGQQLHISHQTVKTHLRTIFVKLEVGDRLELALYNL